MKINSINKTSSTTFSGYLAKTTNQKLNNTNKMDDCIHESHFMRDLNSLSFSTEYLVKNFPEGTRIADYGCSNGEEAYSLATLLSPHNKDAKYKITGYDIASIVIEDAKLALFSIGNIYKNKYSADGDEYEKFLIGRTNYLTTEQATVKKIFDNCFKEIPDEWKLFNIDNPRYKHKVKRLLKPDDDLALTTKRLEYLLKPNNNNYIGLKNFIPRNGVFEKVVKFKIGDAARLNNELKPKSTGAIIFKNSLYHLIGSRPRNSKYVYNYKNVNITPAKKLFQKIHNALQDNGIFVLGTLCHDHLYIHSEENIHQIKQAGQTISVFDSSPIHKALRKANFEPIFYESIKTGGENFMNCSIYLPSVWRKVPTIHDVTSKKFFSKLIAKLF